MRKTNYSGCLNFVTLKAVFLLSLYTPRSTSFICFTLLNSARPHIRNLKLAVALCAKSVHDATTVDS